MRVAWNPHEIVPLDLGDDPQDYVVELSGATGNQLTVKRTQINGAGEVWITINGFLGGSGKTPEALIVLNEERMYAIRCFTYEDDSKPCHEAPILSSEIKGKTVRLRVDVCL